MLSRICSTCRVESDFSSMNDRGWMGLYNFYLTFFMHFKISVRLHEIIIEVIFLKLCYLYFLLISEYALMVNLLGEIKIGRRTDGASKQSLKPSGRDEQQGPENPEGDRTANPRSTEQTQNGDGGSRHRKREQLAGKAAVREGNSWCSDG